MKVEFDGVNKMNGIFYTWSNTGKNPHDYVVVTSSPFVSNYLPEHLLTQEADKNWYSAIDGPHWFMFEFKKINFSVTRYSFKQYGNTNLMASWIFEGSVDGKNWVRIDSKNSPLNVCNANEVLSFAVTPSPMLKFFRVSETANCETHYTLMNSFDMFGTIPGNHSSLISIRCQTKSIYFSHILLFVLFLAIK